MEDNLDFFPVKPSEMERNNFRKQNGNLQLASSLRSSSSIPGFFYFTRTNDVLSFAACCNRRSSARVSWHQSDRIKTSQKEAFPLVEVELKRPDRNCSPFQALGQWSATRRKRARKTIRKKEGEGERRERLVPSLPPLLLTLVVFFFCSHLFAQSPQSERLEQAT